MAWATIHKPAAVGVEPNVVDYEDARRRFDWAGARADLDGLPGGAGLNIAHEAVDRWTAGPTASKVALRGIDRAGDRRDVTYGELKSSSELDARSLSQKLGGTTALQPYKDDEANNSWWRALTKDKDSGEEVDQTQFGIAVWPKGAEDQRESSGSIGKRIGFRNQQMWDAMKPAKR